MDISGFFNSHAGMYITQSFFHSLIAVLVVNASLEAWKITDPLIRQRFRLIVVFFPLVSYPLFQMINPQRGSISFRLDAFLDANRWLNLELWGKVPVGLLFMLLLVFTALVFLFQEMVPIVRQTILSRNREFAGEKPDNDGAVRTALALLPDPRPDVFLIDDDEFLMYSTTGKRQAVFLSTGFAKALTVEELRAAIAHEIGHIARSRRPLLMVVYLLRMMMFFNPVILTEFRRIVQEEERICDDFAVSLTGNSLALAETLRKFYYADDDPNPASQKRGQGLRERLEEYSHAMLLESRISVLEEGLAGKKGGELFVGILTFMMILFISYSVV
jgi:hypothetical protein